MICQACGFESPPEMSFCGKCGSRLKIACKHCGTDNPPDARYCRECAAELLSDPPAAPTPRHDPALNAERRPVTVLFCDLVESTALSCRLDPEELRDIVVRYQQVAAAVIGRYGGYIAQYLGDGLLVYFGYPEASEDSPRLAVSSGLAIVDAVQKLNRELQCQWDIELATRVGIHTGFGVASEVGAGGRTDQLFFGSTPNIAARAEASAAVDTVVITRATRDLVHGFFEIRSLGRERMKGVAEPVELFQALRESGVRNRFELAVSSGLTPIVGREKECDQLFRLFSEAGDGRGQVVLITGEPGIGKSRLQRWLKEESANRVEVWLSCFCVAQYQDSALNPLIDMLEKRLGLERDDKAEEAIRKLEAGLAHWQLDPAEALPIFAALLSLPATDNYCPISLSPARRKQETLARLLELVLGRDTGRPVVFVVEDLHWADPSTLEFIELLASRVHQHRVLLILTFRAVFRPPWALPDGATTIALERLGDLDTAVMIGEITSGMPLPAEIVRRIVSQTDGVPIFVEELTRMIVDSGLTAELRGKRISDEQLRALGIPQTLQDSLMARLDRLGPGKEVAQVGAVLGREFNYAYLAAVSEMEQRTLHFHLQQLVDAALFVETGQIPDAVYTFRHSLVQDAAYESMLKRRRRYLHERAADVLRERFPEVVDLEPEILSHHLEVGGHPDEATSYRCIAGKRALERSAYIEAIRQFERGLSLIEGLPPRRDLQTVELNLLLSLGLGLIATQGYAAPKVESTYSRAMEVCEKSGDIPFPARYGIWAVAIVRGDRGATEELATWFLEQVEAALDPVVAMMSHAALGTWAFYRAEYAFAREHLERAVALFEPSQHRAITREYAAGGAFFGHMVTTLLWWFTGFPDRACAHQKQCIAVAEGLRDPYTLTLALLYDANLGHELGDVDRVWSAVQRASRMLSESDEDFLFLAAIIKILEGWVLAQRGEHAEGIGLLEQGLAFYQATGAQILIPYYASYHAEALLTADRPAEGLPIIERAIAMSEQNLDRFYGPELLRLRGDLLGSIGAGPERMEACYREALALARSQASLGLELRAALSLCRLLVQQGHHNEPLLLLEGICSRFTEGHLTRDAIAARTLLQELHARHTGPRKRSRAPIRTKAPE
jgi:class 3 adenylate cyclase/predicted ATPase